MSEADNPIPEAFCNQCCGRLKLELDEKTKQPTYVCLKCGGRPSPLTSPQPQNLAKSYAVNLDYRKRHI